MIQRILSNPFLIYVFSFLLVMLVYLLDWSNLYPSLTTSVLFFFGITFFIAICFGILVDVLKRIEFQPIAINEHNRGVTFFILISYGIEFIYNGGIPLIIVLKGGGDYDYRLFGIPTFHVFIATLNCFYSVYIFHQWVSQRKSKLLLYFLINVTPMLLIVSRGMFLTTLTSCLFLFILSLPKIRVKVVISIAILVLIIFYFFGVLGNIRMAHETSSKYMLKISNVSDEFKKSSVPDPYIWSYMYISSPLANLQYTINKSRVDEMKWINFLNYELFPDFISKRIGSLFNIEKNDMPRIASWLTVSTFYARSYYFLGWLGMILMFLFFLISTFLYLFTLKKSKTYYVTGLALINTVIFYSTFDNMYAFTGLSFQLIYPVIFSYIKFPRFNLSIKS